jgi:hypothetical protein
MSFQAEMNVMNPSTLSFGRSMNAQDPVSSFENAGFTGNRRTEFEPSSPNSDAFEERTLKDYFVRTVVPPIIAQVETQLRWSSMRQILISMSTSSAMVHYTILAFSELLLGRMSQTQTPNYQK